MFLERSTVVALEPQGPDFWDRPFPSDLRREADGTIDLDRWPRADESSLLRDWFGTADRRLRDGWGLSSAVFVPLSGPIDAQTLPSGPDAARAAEATVFLVDIDPRSPERGRRFPLAVRQVTEVDRYTPEHLLVGRPVFGFVRRPDTLYALVVTDGVRDVNGEPLGASRSFYDGFFEETGPPEVVTHYARLKAALQQDGIDVSRVVGAAVFETFDPMASLVGLAEWAEARPAPALSAPWRVRERFASYTVLEGAMEVPVIQRGERPYTAPGEGVIVRDASGEPVVREMQAVRLVLAVPKQPMPPDGFPLTLYMHGSGGDANQAIERGPRSETDVNAPADGPGLGPAEWLARRGVASLGFDFPLHGTRHTPPDSTGLLLYNLFGNIGATLDNFDVAAMELTQISRLAVETDLAASLDPDLDAGGAPDGRIRFDPERLSAFGQSMGTTIGVNWAAVDPRVKGLVFSGAGGILVEIAVSAVEPIPLKPVAELALNLAEDGAEVHLDHPILHAMQNVWDLVEPVVKAPYVVARPLDGRAPRHVFMTAGVIDGYFHPRSEAAMAVGLGVPLVGERVEDILPSTLELAGRSPVAYPAEGTVNGRTAGVVQYRAPNTLGHYVVFNQEGARYQYTCFLASVGAAAVRIPPPAALDAPCP